MKAYIYRNNELQRVEHIHGDTKPYGKGKDALKAIFKELKNIQGKNGNNYFVEIKYN